MKEKKNLSKNEVKFYIDGTPYGVRYARVFFQEIFTVLSINFYEVKLILYI